ncbi:MAG: choice-of-anchor V domain-containing protein [Acidobacteriota bacterium]
MLVSLVKLSATGATTRRWFRAGRESGKMARFQAKQKLQIAIVMLFATIVAYASVQGPEPGYTNAPNDLGNCTSCHDKHLVDTGPGNVRISGLPAVYQPGQTYTFSVTTSQANRIRFGFQLTALDQLGKKAGALASVDSNTKLLFETGVGGRQYIEHSEAGTMAALSGSRTWQLRWTAPATDIGTVRFHVAGNATNNSGVQDDDDWIYTNSMLVDSPTTLVTLSLETLPDGQTLQAGSVFALDWTTTNPSNIDNTELRYSTDDGATFPISNQILFTTDTSITSHEWTIPNTPSTDAKLRVKIGKKSGDAVEVVTDVFAIAGDGSGLPAPRITGASLSGKKLYVTGENFQMGAKVELNGEKQKTVNEEDFSHSLKCKKAGKNIEAGVPVTLVVKNADGTRSQPFTFVKT